MNKTNFVVEAMHLKNLGISVIPARLDVKSPAMSWKEYQTRHMTDVEINTYFSNCGGVIAICGKISRLFVLDFDLKNEMESDDYWADYIALVPPEILKKTRINKTRNGGYHIWMRTDYSDKPRKLTNRFLTPMEMQERYEYMLAIGSNHKSAMRLILNNPTECVIETRSEKTYGVMVHESYEKYYGETIGELTEAETNILIDAAYALDCMYKKKETFVGQPNDFRIIREFNDDCGAEGAAKLLELSGMYRIQQIDFSGNYRMHRLGSNSEFSAYVYGDSGIFKSFGTNALAPEKDVMTPFEIYCKINEFERGEAISKIRQKRGDK